MEISRSSSFPVVLAPASAVRGGAPVPPAAAAGAGSDSVTTGTASDQNQAPPPSDRAPPVETGGGLTGVTEALYRLRSNWSAASHQGKSAIVALPRPDVIAAYHRDDAPPVASPDAVGGADTASPAVASAHVDTLA